MKKMMKMVASVLNVTRPDFPGNFIALRIRMADSTSEGPNQKEANDYVYN